MSRFNDWVVHAESGPEPGVHWEILKIKATETSPSRFRRVSWTDVRDRADVVIFGTEADGPVADPIWGECE